MPSKRARRPIAKTPETTPQANVALQGLQGKTQSKSAPKLPHEHDESPAAPSRPGAAMVQAEHDVAQGQKDTDRYTEATRTFERGPAKKKQRR